MNETCYGRTGTVKYTYHKGVVKRKVLVSAHRKRNMFKSSIQKILMRQKSAIRERSNFSTLGRVRHKLDKTQYVYTAHYYDTTYNNAQTEMTVITRLYLTTTIA